MPNQQYNFVQSPGNGVSIGVNGPAASPNAVSTPIFDLMNSVNTPANSNFTYDKDAPAGTGINVATNRAVNFFTSTTGLRLSNAALPTLGNDVRYYLSDLTITFNRPITNPVLHVAGLGGFITELNFSSELELATPGLTLTRLSGSTEFSVPNNTQILNSATVYSGTTGSGSASGSVVVNGSNISSVTFRVYMKAKVTMGQSPIWGITTTHVGDRFSIGVSTLESDLSITKTVNNSSPIAGSPVTFTILAANNGVSNDTNVTVNDLLPIGFTYVSSSTATGSYNPATGIWNVGNLDMGDTASLTVTATVNANGNHTNTASIRGDNTDPNLVNNSSSVSVSPQIDSDGDGIADNIDLDDDNDGILDTVEGLCSGNILQWTQTESDPLRNGFRFVYGTDPYVRESDDTRGTTIATANFSTATSFSATKLGFDFSFDDFAYGLRTELWINGTRYMSIAIPDDQGPPLYWVEDTNAVTVTAPVTYYNGASGNLSQVIESKLDPPASTGVTVRNSITLNFPSAQILTSGSIQIRNISQRTTAQSIVASGDYNYWIKIPNCDGIDTDGDGIPDHLDLDSDNDGCLDALEGDENVTVAQLTNASGSVTVGPGSPASNQNLGIIVNANGVPTVVNSGGAADISGDQAQGLGTSANAALKDSQCLKFECTSAMYLSQNTPTSLYDINTTSNPLTFPQIGANSGITYNAIGLNPKDGFIYGIIVNTNQIIRIYSDGTYTNLGAVSGLPNGLTYNAGEIDDAGNYYVKQNTNNNKLYKINLTTLSSTIITLTSSVDVPDIAYNVINDLLYGVNATNGQLVSINPNTNAVVAIGITPGNIQFGGMFGSSTGEIYGVSNAGSFYQFNLLTGARTLISNAPISASNDGAHCVTAPITFAANLSVSKNDGKAQYLPGTTNTYTIVARNDGPFGVVNASVTDNIPAGIPSANMSYTAVASAGSSTAVVGTQTGAINDLVSLPVNGAVTYTVTINIPSSYTGDLVNTVTITPPANAFDSDLTDNTATDTDTFGACYNAPNTGTLGIDTKIGITLLQRAGAENGNWPMIRKSAHTVLESNTKGFVITRMASPETAVTKPQEGMIVYDTDNLCLKIYDGTSWSCFNTPACP